MEEELSSLHLKLMEGYSDAVVPPLTYFQSPVNDPGALASPENGKFVAKANLEAKEPKNKETLVIERTRRCKMNELYTKLQFMIPTMPSKATRVEIIEETIKYIGALEKLIKEEESAKKLKDFGIPPNMGGSRDIIMNISGHIASIGIHTRHRPGITSRVFNVFEKLGLDILTSGISSYDNEIMLTITACIKRTEENNVAAEVVFEKLKHELLMRICSH
ncbi:hypothetical protein AMTRI_Chr02g221930 [Amborella trichopoda]|uniref:BHLH domain-containing protein n=1 Tax=Amborella trichopoda TaxID=13333 RepID=U5CUA0_AMBTC|nr:hypothetical protein AMTR_s00057p00158210 [Amborella trichopoda]